MRRLIIFLCILLISVYIGIEIMRHPGYILVVYLPWMVQMPLWFALLCTVIIFALFYLCIDCIDQIKFLWYRYKNWLRFRREHQSYTKTQQAISQLIEGYWQKAERLFLAGMNQTVEPLVNYLGAAKAAQMQGALERRDSYIHKASQAAPQAELAIGLVRAELELEQDQLEHAVATLNHLKQLSPRHPIVLKLLKKAYVRLADWQNLLILLPALRKSKAIDSVQYDQFEKNIYCELMHASSTKSKSEIEQLWNTIPKSVRKHPQVIDAYVKQLLRFKETTDEIEELIRKAFKTGYQPELITIYGALPFTNLNRQLAVVGNWLKTYGQRPELLLLLGNLCVRVQLWGKAKDYFERCLTLGPNASAALQYGQLLEHLDERDEALIKYREGLAQLANLPSPIVSHPAEGEVSTLADS